MNRSEIADKMRGDAPNVQRATDWNKQAGKGADHRSNTEETPHQQ